MSRDPLIKDRRAADYSEVAADGSTQPNSIPAAPAPAAASPPDEAAAGPPGEPAADPPEEPAAPGDVARRDEPASTASLWTLVREDWRTHRRSRTSLLEPGLHALFVYRIGHWRRRLPRLLRLPVTIWYRLTNDLLIRNVYGMEISDEAVIGRRVHFGHHQSVIIVAFVVIGDDTTLRH